MGAGKLFDHVPDPVVVADRAHLHIVAVNRAARRRFGIGPDDSGDLIGLPLTDLLVDAPDPLGDAIKIAVGDVGLSLTVRNGPDRNPTRVHATVSAGPTDARSSWLLSFRSQAGTGDDFAKLNEELRVETERALRRQRERLALSNRELRAAQEELRSLNLDLEHFAHVAAHDLREPCRRQVGLVNSLRADLGDDVDPEIGRQLDMIWRQGTEMLTLIDGFRALADLTGPEIEQTDVPLAAVVDEIIATQIPEAERVGVLVDLPDSVRGYEPLIRILFENLIANVVHHGRRPLRVEISADRRDDALVYRLENDADHELDHAADPLRPLVRGSSRSAGTGLGLSVCTRSVQRHGGRIWVQRSDETFSVNFTLAREHT